MLSDGRHTTTVPLQFIEVADDCPAHAGRVPPEKEPKTVARLQYEMIAAAPYRYTSDEVVFAAWAAKNGVDEAHRAEAWTQFFAKGQPCLRASPLTKTYGWGVHSDAEGRVALVAADSPEYQAHRADPGLVHVKAMRSSRG